MSGTPRQSPRPGLPPHGTPNSARKENRPVTPSTSSSRLLNVPLSPRNSVIMNKLYPQTSTPPQRNPGAARDVSPERAMNIIRHGSISPMRTYSSQAKSTGTVQEVMNHLAVSERHMKEIDLISWQENERVKFRQRLHALDKKCQALSMEKAKSEGLLRTVNIAVELGGAGVVQEVERLNENFHKTQQVAANAMRQMNERRMLTPAIRLLRRNVDQQRIFKRRLANWTQYGLPLQKTKSAFSHWRVRVMFMRQKVLRVRRFLKKQTRAAVFDRFLSWHALTSYKRLVVNRAQSLLTRLLLQKTRLYFSRWNSSVSQRRQKKGLVKKSMRRVRYLQMSARFECWKVSLFNVKRLNAIGSRLKAKIEKRAIDFGLKMWKSTWKMKTSSRHSCVRIVERVFHRQMAMAWTQWSTVSATMRLHRLQLSRLILALKGGRALIALRTWQDAVDEIVAQRTRYHKIGVAISRNKIYRALQQWQNMTSQSKYPNPVESMAARSLARRVAHAVGVWKETIRLRAHARLVMTRAVMRMQHANLIAGWDSMLTYVERCKHVRLVMDHFGRRIRYSKALGALSAMKEWISRRHAAHEVMEVCKRRILCLRQRGGLVAWQEYLVAKRILAHKREVRNVTIIRRVAMKRAHRALQAWRVKLQLHKQWKALYSWFFGRAYAKLQDKLLMFCAGYSRSQGGEESDIQRYLDSGYLNRQMQMCFVTWATWYRRALATKEKIHRARARHNNSQMQLSYSAWIDYAHSTKAKRLRFGSVMSHSERARIVYGFRKMLWYSTTREDSRNILMRCYIRVATANVRHGLETWKKYAVTRIRSRRVLSRVKNRVETIDATDKAAGWFEAFVARSELRAMLWKCDRRVDRVTSREMLSRWMAEWQFNSMVRNTTTRIRERREHRQQMESFEAIIWYAGVGKMEGRLGTALRANRRLFRDRENLENTNRYLEQKVANLKEMILKKTESGSVKKWESTLRSYDGDQDVGRDGPWHYPKQDVGSAK